MKKRVKKRVKRQRLAEQIAARQTELKRDIEAMKKQVKRQPIIGFAARRVFKVGQLVQRHIWPKKTPPAVPPP